MLDHIRLSISGLVSGAHRTSVDPTKIVLIPFLTSDSTLCDNKYASKSAF